VPADQLGERGRIPAEDERPDEVAVASAVAGRVQVPEGGGQSAVHVAGSALPVIGRRAAGAPVVHGE
jgi:hypothetical protein